MAMTYQNFASLGINLNRQKYGPLDISQVFNSEIDLKYYVSKATDASVSADVSEYWKDIVPYPYDGQIISLVTDDSTTVYVLVANGETFDYVPVSLGKPDNKTITKNDNDEITLANIPTTEHSGLVPHLNSDGTLSWISYDDNVLDITTKDNTSKLTLAGISETKNENGLYPKLNPDGTLSWIAYDKKILDVVESDTGVSALTLAGIPEEKDTNGLYPKLNPDGTLSWITISELISVTDEHTHEISAINGLQARLDNMIVFKNYANAN